MVQFNILVHQLWILMFRLFQLLPQVLIFARSELHFVRRAMRWQGDGLVWNHTAHWALRFDIRLKFPFFILIMYVLLIWLALRCHFVQVVRFYWLVVAAVRATSFFSFISYVSVIFNDECLVTLDIYGLCDLLFLIQLILWTC